MTPGLDAIVTSLDLPEALHPDDPRFRRELLLELRKTLIVRRGVLLRISSGRRNPA